MSLLDRINESEKQGLITKEAPVQKKEGFVKSVAKDIVKPFAELGVSAFNAGRLTGEILKGPNESGGYTYYGNKSYNLPFLGETKPAFTGQEGGLEFAKKVGGYGAELAPYLMGAGAVSGAAKVGVGTLAKTSAKTLLKQAGKSTLKAIPEFALAGGLMSGGRAAQENKGIGEIAGQAGIGALTGAAMSPLAGVMPLAGAGLKAGMKAGSKIMEKVAPNEEQAIRKVGQEIYGVLKNYAKTRKAMDYSRDAQAGSIDRIAKSNVLAKAVDKDGTINVKQAHELYKGYYLDGTEGIGRKTLEKEGAAVGPDIIAKQLEDNIMNSGLEGKALTKAKNAISAEIEGLMLRADANGNIPLTALHDAKINAANLINWQTDSWVKAEQKAIAKAYRETIEKTSKTNIKEINQELQKYIQDLELLESLNGRKINGGKLGKYFSQITGNIIGATVGGMFGPAGSIVGTVAAGEAAGALRGAIMSKTFGGIKKGVIEKSPILEKAVQDAESPRLMLPAPTSKFRSEIKSGPTINLPEKAPSTIDAQSYIVGTRNNIYNIPSTKIKPTSINSNINSKVKANTKVEKSQAVANKLSDNLKITDAYGKNFMGYNMAELAKVAKQKNYNLYDALIKKVDSQSNVQKRIDGMESIMNDLYGTKKGSPAVGQTAKYSNVLEALRSPKMKAKYAKIKASQKIGKVTKTSNNLYHTTKAENLDSIIKNGLTTNNKARYTDVSGKNKISFSANEVGAKYYGGQNDVMLRTKASYKPDDLDIDLLAGGIGTYRTSKNIPPEMLEIKQGNKWIPLNEYKTADLIQEAKKYKTAEEFAYKIGNTDRVKEIGDDLVIYKGVGGDLDINARGLDYIDKVAASAKDMPKGTISFTDDFKTAWSYADYKKDGSPNVKAYLLPKSKVMPDSEYTDLFDKFYDQKMPEGKNYASGLWRRADKFPTLVDDIKKAGYSAFRDTNGEIVVLDKSQLIDIWNKAQGKTNLKSIKASVKASKK